VTQKLEERDRRVSDKDYFSYISKLKMKEITKEFAQFHNLKKLGSIIDNDISKTILKIERLKENKMILYYTMDLIIFDSIKHQGTIEVSFWTD
jgi:hypothetical protein